MISDYHYYLYPQKNEVPQQNFIGIFLFMDELSNLEIFFESSPDLLCIAGFDGYFKRINAAVSDVLGYTKEELLANPIDSFVHEEDRGITSTSRRNVIAGSALRNFDNRYRTKTGEIVWLTWTSVQIEGKELIFGVAKDITHRKKLEEYRRISDILAASDSEDNGKEDKEQIHYNPKISHADQVWLSKLEGLIRKYTGHFDITISMLSNEMAISERQLFRRIKTTVGLTPNRYIRIIRLQLAKEALKSGKFRTITEVSLASGFKTPGYFNKLFKDIYGSDVSEFI